MVVSMENRTANTQETVQLTIFDVCPELDLDSVWKQIIESEEILTFDGAPEPDEFAEDTQNNIGNQLSMTHIG